MGAGIARLLHWPEYVMEGAELGVLMLMACAATALLESPTSAVHYAIAERHILVGSALTIMANALRVGDHLLGRLG